jgi:hypothetical protein
MIFNKCILIFYTFLPLAETSLFKSSNALHLLGTPAFSNPFSMREHENQRSFEAPHPVGMGLHPTT